MRCPAAPALFLLALVATPLAAAAECPAPSSGPVLSVVATLPDYTVLTQAIGGGRVSVQSIVQGDQDAHFMCIAERNRKIACDLSWDTRVSWRVTTLEI